MSGSKFTKAEIVAQALIEGRAVELRGFGTFDIKRSQGRTGRNPKTGQQVEVQSQ